YVPVRGPRNVAGPAVRRGGLAAARARGAPDRAPCPLTPGAPRTRAGRPRMGPADADARPGDRPPFGTGARRVRSRLRVWPVRALQAATGRRRDCRRPGRPARDVAGTTAA